MGFAPEKYELNACLGELLMGIPANLTEEALRTQRERLANWQGYLVFAGFAGDATEPVETRKGFEAAIRREFGQRLIFLQWDQGAYYGVLKAVENQEEAARMARSFVERVDCYLALSRWAEGADELLTQYLQVSDMIDYAVLTGRRVFTAGELPEVHYDRSCRVLKSKLEYEYIKAVASKEFAVAYHHLERIVQQELDEDMRAVRRLKHRLLARTENAMQIMGIAVDDPKEQSVCRRLFGSTARMSSLQELLPAVQNIYLELDREAHQRSSAGKEKPDEVLDFLDTHFSDPELDTTMVAEACHVSKSYVSNVVNRQGGSSFADYVNALRIGAAKELLKNSEMTVDEIGTFVGFTNRWTMLRAFKKFVGMTPQSYRTYSTVKTYSTDRAY